MNLATIFENGTVWAIIVSFCLVIMFVFKFTWNKDQSNKQLNKQSNSGININNSSIGGDVIGRDKNK